GFRLRGRTGHPRALRPGDPCGPEALRGSGAAHRRKRQLSKMPAKSKLKRAPARRTPRKAKAGTRGLSPAESRIDSLPADAQEARERVEAEGGLVIGAYNDPLGKNAL